MPATSAKPRLEKMYHDVILGHLQKTLGLNLTIQAPRLNKITINMGLGEAVRDKNAVAAAIDDMTKITGQKAIVTRARKSIAAFGIREGWPIGCKVTLRRTRMYEFLDRLINVAIPRIRDFRGLSPKSFDGSGNYTIGISEQIVFPEIDYDKIDHLRGMDITLTTSTNSDQYAYALLKEFNFPFKNQEGV